MVERVPGISFRLSEIANFLAALTPPWFRRHDEHDKHREHELNGGGGDGRALMADAGRGEGDHRARAVRIALQGRPRQYTRGRTARPRLPAPPTPRRQPGAQPPDTRAR